MQAVVNRLGFLRKVERVLRHQVRSAAALCCFTVTVSDHAVLPEVGRAALRTWLHLCAAGYGLQPFTAGSLGLFDLAAGAAGDVAPAFHAAWKDGAERLRRQFSFPWGERWSGSSAPGCRHGFPHAPSRFVVTSTK